MNHFVRIQSLLSINSIAVDQYSQLWVCTWHSYCRTTVLQIQAFHRHCTNCTFLSVLASALYCTVLLSSHWPDHCTLLYKWYVQRSMLSVPAAGCCGRSSSWTLPTVVIACAFISIQVSLLHFKSYTSNLLHLSRRTVIHTVSTRWWGALTSDMKQSPKIWIKKFTLTFDFNSITF